MSELTTKLRPITLLRAIAAYARIVRDPNQLAEVFKLSDSLNETHVSQRLVRALRTDASVARALDQRKRVAVDLPALSRLPPGTLGRTYADFMKANSLVPDALPRLPAKDDGEFLRAHLYETHDMWHAITGFDSDIAGELGLQGFYSAQIDGPLAPAILAAGLLNTALFAMDERTARLDAIARGWEGGRRAKPLFGYDYASSWAKPIADVRRELGIPAEGLGRVDVVAIAA